MSINICSVHHISYQHYTINIHYTPVITATMALFITAELDTQVYLQTMLFVLVVYIINLGVNVWIDIHLITTSS